MSEITPKLLSIEGWIEANFGAGAPTPRTVRRWIRGGYILPAPEKLGSTYYLRSDARYIDPANPPADMKPTGRAYPLLIKAGFIQDPANTNTRRSKGRT